MARFVVVHDSSCGGCSSIAARLGDVLAVPVVVRSCRDPRLAEEFPVLSGVRPCARPLAVAVDHAGGMEPLAGVRLLWRGAALVGRGNLPAALGLAVRIAWRRPLHRRW